MTVLRSMTHLDELEAESIYIMREVAAQFRKPVMLYSIGKDSSVMLQSGRQQGDQTGGLDARQRRRARRGRWNQRPDRDHSAIVQLALGRG
jgi:hypothetical protein